MSFGLKRGLLVVAILAIGALFFSVQRSLVRVIAVSLPVITAMTCAFGLIGWSLLYRVLEPLGDFRVACEIEGIGVLGNTIVTDG